MNPKQTRDRLDELWCRGLECLGTRYAIMGGAMTWVSERHLVAALSNGGGFGVIANGAMMPDQLADEIDGTMALTEMPFGVNLVTMHPDLEALCDTCLAKGLSHVVLAGGLPRAVIEGDMENGSLMAGQSVGMVKEEQAAAAIIEELVDQAAAVLLARESIEAAE